MGFGVLGLGLRVRQQGFREFTSTCIYIYMQICVCVYAYMCISVYMLSMLPSATMCHYMRASAHMCICLPLKFVSI